MTIQQLLLGNGLANIHERMNVMAIALKNTKF
jgi:hypothetical protein